MVPRKSSITKDVSTRLLFPAASMHGEIESDKAWREVAGPRWWAPAPIEPFAAVDFESYYDGAYSFTTMSPWEYIAHPMFEATLVALEWYDGLIWRRWVGKVEDAPWDDLPNEWWSHNANFDELVYRRLLSIGKVKRKVPDIWNCTADLAAHLQLDRGLDRCAPLLINEVADKTVRQKMKGGGANPTEQKDYAATDSRQCAWIRHAHGHRWPEIERFLSRLIRRSGYRGVYADQDLMTNARAAMVTLLRRIEKEVPWGNKFPITSDKGINHHCDIQGIPRPPSLSLDDKETEQWQKRHDKWGWLDKIKDYTKAKQVISHVDMMKERTRKDGTIPFELIYAKAPHTKRWQSGSGLRMQNLDKESFNGFHVRHFISVPPGDVMLSADSSQIEPRVLNWLVRDTVFLDACKAGSSPYDAHARSTMGWTGGDLKKLSKTDSAAMALYALAKARVLALGYQAGPPKFVEMARTMAGLTVFETEVSWSSDLKSFYRESEISDRLRRGDIQGWVSFPSAVDAVADFRAKSKLVVDYWWDTEDAMRNDVGQDHIVTLPNGEHIYYFDVAVGPETRNPRTGRIRRGELSAWVVKDSRNPDNKKYLYGGKLVENKVQRVAREILAYFKWRAARELGPYGLRVVWSVHDELNCYCKKTEAKYLNDALVEIMSTAPYWAPDLPVAVESQILDHYVK